VYEITKLSEEFLVNAMTLQNAVSNNTRKTEGTPYRVLQNLIDKQASGKLVIQNPLDPSIHWRVYLGNGRIHYAGSGMGHAERLNYLFGRYLPNQKSTLPPEINDDYQYLCELWQTDKFSFQEIRAILAKFTQEALIEILSQNKAFCYFENIVGLERLLLYLNLKKLMLPVESKVRFWWQLRVEIMSPFQRPLVTNRSKLIDLMDGQLGQISPSLRHLTHFLEDQGCLYELANQMEISTLKLGTVLSPLIQEGIITMGSYILPKSDTRPIVACIDDSPAIQRVVKFTLESSGYRVISIKESLKALTSLLSPKPDLILMDINMPDIDGYQLCSLCRKSSALKDIPIIMLTGRDGILDRVKAKMVGSVGYMSKPFLPQELVKIVNAYLPVTNRRRY
jgi:twitching motility two-component system response regulator PilG